MFSQPRLHAPVANRPRAFAVTLACLLMAAQAQDLDLESKQNWLLRGEYEQVIEVAKKALASRPGDAGWSLLLGQALMETRRYS